MSIMQINSDDKRKQEHQSRLVLQKPFESNLNSRLFQNRYFDIAMIQNDQLLNFHTTAFLISLSSLQHYLRPFVQYMPVLLPHYIQCITSSFTITLFLLHLPVCYIDFSMLTKIRSFIYTDFLCLVLQLCNYIQKYSLSNFIEFTHAIGTFLDENSPNSLTSSNRVEFQL